jgi:hypothetical protein
MLCHAIRRYQKAFDYHVLHTHDCHSLRPIKVRSIATEINDIEESGGLVCSMRKAHGSKYGRLEEATGTGTRSP